LALTFALDNVDPDFVQFMMKYDKSYALEELNLRATIFQDNKIRAAKLNVEARNHGANTKYGITKFSDLSPEEFGKLYLGYKPSKTYVNAPVFKDDGLTDIPTSFDWRDKKAVTPVKDQQQCGSCWAFSATEGIESAWFLAKGNLPVLSPQQIVSCDENDDGCNGGDLPTAFQYVQQNGQEPDSDYPYTSGGGDTGRCKYNKNDVVAKISGFQYATQSRNETAMQAAMVTKGPLSICVDAETWQFYTGGVIKNNCADDLDHCVQLVGWNTNSASVPYWIVRNSWGTDWGLEGYLWVERNKDLCGIADEATYVTI